MSDMEIYRQLTCGTSGISVSRRTAMGLPSFVAGSNFHLLIVLSAKSSKSGLERFNSRMSTAEPSGVTTNETRTLRFFSMLAGGGGIGVETGRGAVTPPVIG